MGILPKNQKKKTVDTPKNFFIYGGTMNGKSYLAGEFPNPLFLDTDGNADANPYPSIKLRNIRGRDGKIEKSIADQLDQIVTELQTTNHGFDTVVLDVIDDVVVMLEQYICDREGVEALADIPYGKGYAAFTNIFQTLVIELKALPINVVYVSRISTRQENGMEVEEPSLKEKHVNIVNGNCDFMIQAKKVGKNYLRLVKMKRKNYDRDGIEDERILSILDTLTGAFEKSKRTSKKKQDEIAKKLEKQQEEVLTKSDEDNRKDEKEPETKKAKPTPGNKTVRPKPKTKPQVNK